MKNVMDLFLNGHHGRALNGIDTFVKTLMLSPIYKPLQIITQYYILF